jgi:hypothetical protein
MWEILKTEIKKNKKQIRSRVNRKKITNVLLEKTKIKKNKKHIYK